VLWTASAAVTACDLEAVPARAEPDWERLIGPQRLALARTAAGAGEDLSTAATRCWSVAECLKKAEIPLDATILLEETGPGGWVYFTAGGVEIATWAGAIEGSSPRFVCAVLRPARPGPAGGAPARSSRTRAGLARR
jgi:enediyne polyketide synthase